MKTIFQNSEKKVLFYIFASSFNVWVSGNCILISAFCIQLLCYILVKVKNKASHRYIILKGRVF